MDDVKFPHLQSLLQQMDTDTTNQEDEDEQFLTIKDVYS